MGMRGKTSVCTPAAFKQRRGQDNHHDPRTPGRARGPGSRRAADTRACHGAADKEQNALPECSGGGGRSHARAARRAYSAPRTPRLDVTVTVTELVRPPARAPPVPRPVGLGPHRQLSRPLQAREPSSVPRAHRRAVRWHAGFTVTAAASVGPSRPPRAADQHLTRTTSCGNRCRSRRVGSSKNKLTLPKKLCLFVTSCRTNPLRKEAIWFQTAF